MENPTLCTLPDMVNKTDLQFLFFLVLCFGNNISGLFYTSHLYLTQKYVGYYWTLGVEVTMNYIGTLTM